MNESKNNKLNGFIVAVNSDINESISKLIEEANQRRYEIIKEAKDEALNESYIKIKTEVKNIGSKYQILLSKKEQEYKIKILKYKESLFLKIFHNIEDKLIEFTHKEEYKEFLFNQIESEEIDENSIIYLNSKDMKFKEDIINFKSVKCSFEVDNSIKIGGLSVFYPQKSILINKTIDFKLEDQKKNFANNYKFNWFGKLQYKIRIKNLRGEYHWI